MSSSEDCTGLGSLSDQNGQGNKGSGSQNEAQRLPISKRIACTVCRKRKLRCDGNRPSCSTCLRFHHDCVYEDVRRKSGPKRGHVKMLEERLAHVESLLDRQNSALSSSSASNVDDSSSFSASSASSTSPSDNPHSAKKPFPESNGSKLDREALENLYNVRSSLAMNFVPTQSSSGVTGSPFPPKPQPYAAISALDPSKISKTFKTSYAAPQSLPYETTAHPHLPNMRGLDKADGTVPPVPFPAGATHKIFDLISLGMEEPLPPQEEMDELTSLYFSIIHPSTPMIHKARYLAACQFPHPAGPPLYLRYAILAMAAVSSEKYSSHASVFHQRAYNYLHSVYYRGQGETMASVPYVQAWTLMAMYEYKTMAFPRAWSAVGQATRACLMLQLNLVDSPTVTVKQCLPPPADWIEVEERRRTFWCSYMISIYASLGTGWAGILDELDIVTGLSSSEEAFETGNKESPLMIDDCLAPNSRNKFPQSLSPFAAKILIIVIIARIHKHLHRGERAAAKSAQQPPEFYERFHSLDNLIHQIVLKLPDRLKRSFGAISPEIAQLHMTIHASVICLHQATVLRSWNDSSKVNELESSKQRCMQASSEMAEVMRQCSHFGASMFDAFQAFCLYISARCFIQALRMDRQAAGMATRAQLDFMLTALDNIKESLPVSQCFLLQLEVDMSNLLSSEASVDQWAETELQEAFNYLGSAIPDKQKKQPVNDSTKARELSFTVVPCIPQRNLNSLFEPGSTVPRSVSSNNAMAVDEPVNSANSSNGQQARQTGNAVADSDSPPPLFIKRLQDLQTEQRRIVALQEQRAMEIAQQSVDRYLRDSENLMANERRHVGSGQSKVSVHSAVNGMNQMEDLLDEAMNIDSDNGGASTATAVEISIAQPNSTTEQVSSAGAAETRSNGSMNGAVRGSAGLEEGRIAGEAVLLTPGLAGGAELWSPSELIFEESLDSFLQASGYGGE
ncbi:uncharacterized protein V1516DRAFT_645005 [Lipomyces oligophaga]|uniref:uncharacterized protein n=1 Tax=Lipomyces oligophaga TaxID=45792 RepID=UPI0034CF1612